MQKQPEKYEFGVSQTALAVIVLGDDNMCFIGGKKKSSSKSDVWEGCLLFAARESAAPGYSHGLESASGKWTLLGFINPGFSALIL